MAAAYFADSVQLFPRPHPAYGIVGTAEDHEPRRRVTRLHLQIVKINEVHAVYEFERIVDYFPAVVADCQHEGIKDRLLDDDAFPRLCICLNCEIDGGAHHGGGKNHT